MYEPLVQFTSVTQLCLTLGNAMDCSMPGLPVHHQLPELTQPHVHQVGDAVQTFHPVIPFSSCPQSFPTSGSFPMSQYFSSGGQSIGASASASVLPLNIQDRPPLGLTGLIFLQSKGFSKVFSNNTVLKASVLQCSAFFMVHLSQPSMTTRKTIVLTRWTFVSKVMSLLFNMLSRLVIAFLPRSKCLLISWLQSPSALILEVQENKVSHSLPHFPIYLPWSDGTGCHDLDFLNAEF